MSDQVVVIRKVLQASCDEVFDAWLDAAGMQQWMCPGAITRCQVALDPRVGGRFRIVMTAPSTEFVHTGEFRVIERPSRLQFTWVSSRMSYQETLITIELSPREAACELVLTHERVPREHPADELVRGWNQMLEKLATHLGA
jgi:uncharacterized protein YndB with AHSA1/START domain